MNWLTKILLSGRLAILAAYPFVPNTSCTPQQLPTITSVSPSVLLRGQQNLVVTINGANFSSPTGQTPSVVVDDGNNDGITGTVTSFDDGHIVLNLSVSNTADLGSHSLVVYTHAGGCDKGFNSLLVECDPPNSCPPIPFLEDFNFDISQGQRQTVRFDGSKWFGNFPAIEFDPDQTGLTIPPGTVIDVHHWPDGQDAITIPILAASDAHTGYHRVRIRTSGGRTRWQNFTVFWSPLSPPPPSSIATLTDVYPSNVGPNGSVFIQCHGKGFGLNREVITTPSIPVTTYYPANANVDPDTIVVAKISPTQPGDIKIQVHNLDQDLVSDDIRIFVEPNKPGAPIAIANSLDGVHVGGAPYTFQVTGENLSAVTDASWSYYPGLTFSNTNATATSVTVTVTADSFTPLTGNHPTNLTLTIPGHTSFPFPINILQ